MAAAALPPAPPAVRGERGDGLARRASPTTSSPPRPPRAHRRKSCAPRRRSQPRAPQAWRFSLPARRRRAALRLSCSYPPYREPELTLVAIDVFRDVVRRAQAVRDRRPRHADDDRRDERDFGRRLANEAQGPNSTFA